jgi:hypothetical protein
MISIFDSLTRVWKSATRSAGNFDRTKPVIAVADLLYPDIRRDLILYLADASRIDGPGNSSCPHYDALWFLLHFFFDDTEFNTDAVGHIGLSLVSHR